MPLSNRTPKPAAPLPESGPRAGCLPDRRAFSFPKRPVAVTAIAAAGFSLLGCHTPKTPDGGTVSETAAGWGIGVAGGGVWPLFVVFGALAIIAAVILFAQGAGKLAATVGIGGVTAIALGYLLGEWAWLVSIIAIALFVGAVGYVVYRVVVQKRSFREVVAGVEDVKRALNGDADRIRAALDSKQSDKTKQEVDRAQAELGVVK